MANEQDEIHAETDAARAGSTPHIVRWILILSLFAAIVALSLIWITGAATRGPGPQNVEYTEAAPGSSTEGSTTDSIVGEHADELKAPKVDDVGSSPLPTVENRTEPAPSPTPNTGN
ncbi:MAG: hypothetical protein J7493_09255 [Porphyrobacter sp.]|nr:hypothetical protein [Porphyrobacter sp.]